MRQLLALLLLLMATPALADLSAKPPGAEDRPLSVWRTDDAGAVEHLQSGLTCPQTLAGYARGRIMLFDGYGLDVGCNYGRGKTLITLYLTRRTGAGVDAALTQAKRELLQMSAERRPQLISENRSREADLDWVTTLYSEDGGLHSGIWMADLDGWTLEYRVTYPATDDATVTADLKPFTAMIQKSAGARLGLCARSQPPQRRGAAVSDRKELEKSVAMSGLLGAAAIGATLDAATNEKTGATTPTTWCVEAPVEKADYHMLFWRGVDASGADVRSDRISVMSDVLPPTLVIAPDGLPGLANDASKTKPPRWIATLEDDDRVLIFGYFNGRPAPAAVSDLFGDILANKAKPIGGYSVKDKNVTIIMPPKP